MAERINSFNPRSILEHEEMAHVTDSETSSDDGTEFLEPSSVEAKMAVTVTTVEDCCNR